MYEYPSNPNQYSQVHSNQKIEVDNTLCGFYTHHVDVCPVVFQKQTSLDKSRISSDDEFQYDAKI